MVEYVNEVIVLYVDRKRADLDFSFYHPAVAIFDHLKGQLTVRLHKCWKRTTFTQCLFQLLLLENSNPWISVNMVVKSFIQNKFSEWYAEQAMELFYNDDDPVD